MREKNLRKPMGADPQRRRRNAAKGSRLQLQKSDATLDKISAKLARKKANTLKMKEELAHMMEKLKVMESDSARIRDEYKLALEDNIDLQLAAEYMLFAYLRGGEAGS